MHISDHCVTPAQVCVLRSRFGKKIKLGSSSTAEVCSEMLDVRVRHACTDADEPKSDHTPLMYTERAKKPVFLMYHKCDENHQHQTQSSTSLHENAQTKCLTELR